jgi:CubicO group peptidase (beta-lactamase class C family)
MRLLATAAGTILAIGIWATLVFVGYSEGWGKKPITDGTAPSDFLAAAHERIEARHNGNLSLVLIEGGEIAGTHSMSVGAPVDGSTLFQVASLGKWLAAWGVMVLVEDGAIDLDAPVSTYLTRWELPPGAFDVSGVTVRRLLSHTAGLSDGLGYDGFDAPQEVQTLEASLSRAADASPGNDGVVRLGAEPGEGWAYSGGGYTLLQLLVEEVSGQGFADFMDARVFTPLGMERTTFDHREALALGLAQNFDTDGGVEPFRWYTALAATSLFTTAGDLALFVQSQAPGGERPVLSEATLEMMRTPHASQLGADIWGLGLMLYAPNGKGSHIIGHDGNNGPAINTTARLDPDTGDGIVILATGSPLLATELAGEWVYWKTGRVDNLTFAIGLGSLLLWIGGGALVILVVGILVGWKSRKRRRAAHDFG